MKSLVKIQLEINYASFSTFIARLRYAIKQRRGCLTYIHVKCEVDIEMKQTGRDRGQRIDWSPLCTVVVYSTCAPPMELELLQYAAVIELTMTHRSNTAINLMTNFDSQRLPTKIVDKGSNVMLITFMS